MKYILALAVLMGTLVTAQEQATPERGWYLGANVGTSSLDGDKDGETIDVNKSATTDGKRDTNDSAFGLFGGYRFNKYFAVEGGYTDMGAFDFGEQTTDVSVDAFRAMAVGFLPLGKKWSLNGKLGGARRKLSSRLVEGTEEGDTVDQSETVFSWGGGVQFHFDKNWLMSLSYQGLSLDNPTLIYEDEDEDDLEEIKFDGRYLGDLTLGVTYRF